MAGDPVQSIRIASNLAERFRSILKNPGSDVSQLELAIGEAQQLYPEIWRHLDDARNALRERGTDVSQFDHLRRDELAHLGVTNIESSQQIDYLALMTGALRIATVKTATFNLGGYQRAVAACKTLMAVMPEVDWAALARAEDQQIAAAGSLQASKYLGIVKAVAIFGGLGLVAFGIYKLASNVEPEDPVKTRSSDREAEREAELANVRAKANARSQRIHELRKQYESTCDRSLVAELAALLRDDGKHSEARTLEASECLLPRPSCDDVRDELAHRLARQHSLEATELQCEGVLVSAAHLPALAVAIEGRGKDGKPVALRGIVSPDGLTDVIPFVPVLTPKLLGVADLDRDKSDELVMASDQLLVVSRVEETGFVDADGPTMKGSCRADIHIEGDFRGGAKGEHKVLVLDVPPEVKSKACLPPGRHYFELAEGKLVEKT